MSVTSDFWKAMNQSGVQISGSKSSSKNTSSGSTATGIAPIATPVSTNKKKKKNITEDFWDSLQGAELDIAPVGSKRGSSVADRVQARASGGAFNRKDKDEEDKWIRKGLFDDGYNIGDITKTILGTAGDVAIGAVKGFTSGVEGIVDLGSYGVAGVLDAVGKDDDADRLRRTTAKSQTDQLWGGLEATADKYSILGEKADAVIDPITNALGYIGMMYATAGIGAAAGATGVGATALSTGTMFASSAGGSMGGATDEEALKHGVMKGAVEAGSELIFGGLGKTAKTLGLSRGLSSLDDIFAKKLSDKISNHFWKNAVQYGVKASAEGVEEVLAGLGSAVSKKLTYMSDEDLSKLIKDENLMEQFAVGTAASAIMQSGFVPGTTEGSFKESVTTGRDFITGQTQNEQSVIQKEIENRAAEKEKDGTKLTKKEKAAIEEQVLKDMEKGYISIDTIEEVLGGDSYKNYKKTIDAEDAQIEKLKKQLKELEDAPNTVGNSKKYDALQAKLETMNKRNKSNDLKSRLEKEVYELAKGDRLVESYNERGRHGQAFEADVTKYDAKQQAVIQKAIDSGILNNSNRTHEFVDFIAKISADKGVSFDFTNNAKLKDSGFAVDGKQVNGYVTKDGITLNIDSAKAMESTVGHEITHVLEDTEFYDSLKQTIFDYAKAKGEYQSRYDSLAEVYKDVKDADIEGELTADLVGDYIFSDPDFVKNLSTQNRNIFQKIYDEIKYLCKVVTAGSKEARELERVKKAFEDAYREGGKTKSDAEAETKYSLSDSTGEVAEEQNNRGLNRAEEVSYSLSKDTEYMDKAITMNASSLRVDTKVLEETKALRERIASRMNDIKDRGLVGLPEDIEGNTYIANSSYDGTEENTTICPRSLASEAFVDAVSEYLGRPLTVEEQIYISQDLQGRSLTPECTYCYVATDRKAYRAFLGEYVAQRDAVLEKVKNNPNADVSRSGELYKEFLNGRKDTNPMYSRFKMWVDAYKNGKPMIDASHLANINKLMGDINSEFGAELKPQITDAMKYAQSASWAKKRVNYVAYNGHILKWKQDRINKLNSHYGLRMYSFSDFHPAFVLENMQMITDASVRGLKMLGYTKDTDFVDIFAPSGMNINISTFGFEAGGEVFENNLIGAEWEKAKTLREQYPNVGITFVATNDTLVNWALDQDWIDVVIPFHLVRTGREVAKAFNYHDYTSESSDTKTKDWKKGDKKYIAPTEHNNDKATYLAALEKNHLKPRFERFLENPNYMKLVNECRKPASESKPVQPVFNEDAAKVALAKLEANGYYQPIGGSVDRMYEIAGEVAERMTETLPNIEKTDGWVRDLPMKNSLSNLGEQHTSDSLSALRLETDDIAPVAEDSTVVAENATTTPTVSEMESVGEDVAPVDVSKSPVLKRLNQKLTNNKTELYNVQKLREDSGSSFDEKITKAKEQLDSKKNKDTKAANNLRRRIERLERLKADVDAEYAKRIGSIKSRIAKTEADIQKYHPGLDRAEKAIARIDRRLEADKAELTEEYDLKREQLADKDSFISQKATELYNEIRKLKKGVKASEQLGYLLDHGYEWSVIKSALINVKHTPGGTVNINSEAESVVREMLNENYENAQSDLEVEYLKQVNELEAKADEKRKATSVASQLKAKMEEHSKRWETIIGDTSTWKDMSLGLSYKTKTLRRILRKVVKDANGNADIRKADWIYDELETKYDHNEAQLKQESQKLKEVFFELNLNHAEDTYANMLGELRHNPETTLTEEVVKEYYEKHKGKIDTNKVNKAISEARKTFDGLLVRVNDVLREQGMKEIPYRKGYFPHFTNPKQGWLAKLLNWKTIDNEIPTSIAGLTEMFTPQRSWQSFNKQRMGDKTDYSLYQGLDTYIHGALDWIYHIDDIQSRRALENYLRYTHSDEGVKARIEEIKANDTYDAEEAQKLIDGVLAEANNPLSGLVRELMNRTNTLANKKSSMDRSMEDATNRKIYSTMTNLNNRINANMVVGSFSSALTNFIPMVQSWHQVSPYFTVRGLGDFVRSSVKDDGMVAKSDFLTNRLVEEEKLYQTNWDKISDKAAFMMNVVDNITSQTVWRSKYLQNIKEGMGEAQAIRDADQFSKNLIAGRSRGNAPTIFDVKNPLAKIFTAFQLEVANQYGYMFEDVPQDSKNTARLVKGYATAFLGAYAYNALYSSLVGRDAALDPIGIVEDLLKDLFDEDDEEESLGDELMDFGKSILEEVPFVGGLVGGGRVPMSSAFPYSGYTTPFESMLNDVDNKNWDSLGKEFLKPLYYLAMPVGGGQIKKTIEGLSMFSDEHPIAGSYTTSGNLRFPVDDTFGSKLQAGLFGQYASENARKYFDEEQRTLNADQTEIFAELDIPIEEYWEYRDNLYDFYDVKDELESAAKADGATDEDILKGMYIKSVYSDIYDLYDKQKEIAKGNSSLKKSQLRDIQKQMSNMLADSKRTVNNVNIDGYYATIGDKRYDYSDYNGAWFEISGKYLKNEQKAIERYGVTPSFYWNNQDMFYDADYYFKYKPELETVSKNVFDGKWFAGYAAEVSQIKGDDLNGDGKSDSGTKKKKVFDYISGLDVGDVEKMILYKMSYPSVDDYNDYILEYLNNRDDLTYDVKKSMLEALGATLDDEGYIDW